MVQTHFTSSSGQTNNGCHEGSQHWFLQAKPLACVMPGRLLLPLWFSSVRCPFRTEHHHLENREVSEKLQRYPTGLHDNSLEPVKLNHIRMHTICRLVIMLVDVIVGIILLVLSHHILACHTRDDRQMSWGSLGNGGITAVQQELAIIDDPCSYGRNAKFTL